MYADNWCLPFLLWERWLRQRSRAFSTTDSAAASCTQHSEKARSQLRASYRLPLGGAVNDRPSRLGRSAAEQRERGRLFNPPPPPPPRLLQGVLNNGRALSPSFTGLSTLFLFEEQQFRLHRHQWKYCSALIRQNIVVFQMTCWNWCSPAWINNIINTFNVVHIDVELSICCIRPHTFPHSFA